MNTKRNKQSQRLPNTREHPIHVVRKELNLSQAALASLLGIRQSHLSGCELSQRNLGILTAIKLKKIANDKGIDCTLDFIYSKAK